MKGLAPERGGPPAPGSAHPGFWLPECREGGSQGLGLEGWSCSHLVTMCYQLFCPGEHLKSRNREKAEYFLGPKQPARGLGDHKGRHKGSWTKGVELGSGQLTPGSPLASWVATEHLERG